MLQFAGPVFARPLLEGTRNQRRLPSSHQLLPFVNACSSRNPPARLVSFTRHRETGHPDTWGPPRTGREGDFAQAYGSGSSRSYSAAVSLADLGSEGTSS